MVGIEVGVGVGVGASTFLVGFGVVFSTVSVGEGLVIFFPNLLSIVIFPSLSMMDVETGFLGWVGRSSKLGISLCVVVGVFGVLLDLFGKFVFKPPRPPRAPRPPLFFARLRSREKG